MLIVSNMDKQSFEKLIKNNSTVINLYIVFFIKYLVVFVFSLSENLEMCYLLRHWNLRNLLEGYIWFLTADFSPLDMTEYQPIHYKNLTQHFSKYSMLNAIKSFAKMYITLCCPPLTIFSATYFVTQTKF